MANIRNIAIPTLLKLCELYPKCFFADNREVKPLKVGIDTDLLAEQLTDFSKRALKDALRLYTRRPAYYQKLVVDTPRINLQGEEVGIVTEEHVVAADQARERYTQLKSEAPQSPKGRKRLQFPLRAKKSTGKPAKKKAEGTNADARPKKPYNKKPRFPRMTDNSPRNMVENMGEVNNPSGRRMPPPPSTLNSTTSRLKPTIVVKKRRILSLRKDQDQDQDEQS
jgi:ProP effector